MILKIVSSTLFLLGWVLMLAIVEVSPLADEKTRIGLVEDVILLPWKIRLPARVDTGAGMSSLDAREIVIQGNMVEFRIPAKYGGFPLRLPIVDWQTIRSAEGRERRPVVEIDLCVGSRVLNARFNLNDRSQVKFPVLLGRNILRDRFLIDCEKSNCAPPQCPEAVGK